MSTCRASRRHLTPPWRGIFPHAHKPFPEELGRFQAEWHARGYLASEQLAPDDQAEAVVHVLASRAQIDVMWSRHPAQLQLPGT